MSVAIRSPPQHRYQVMVDEVRVLAVSMTYLRARFSRHLRTGRCAIPTKILCAGAMNRTCLYAGGTIVLVSGHVVPAIYKMMAQEQSQSGDSR